MFGGSSNVEVSNIGLPLARKRTRGHLALHFPRSTPVDFLQMCETRAPQLPAAALHIASKKKKNLQSPGAADADADADAGSDVAATVDMYMYCYC